MDLLAQFELRDVADVLIVAYVLYRGMLLIRGTRAVRIAVGLLVMFVIYLVARQLELRTVDWVLLNVFTYIVFAILILFQSEFRKALANLGRTPFFRDLAAPMAKEPFDDVVSAATAMAKERRGALIVLHLPHADGAARRGGDHPGRPHGGGLVLPAPDHESAPVA